METQITIILLFLVYHVLQELTLPQINQDTASHVQPDMFVWEELPLQLLKIRLLTTDIHVLEDITAQKVQRRK